MEEETREGKTVPTPPLPPRASLLQLPSGLTPSLGGWVYALLFSADEAAKSCPLPHRSRAAGDVNPTGLV